MIVPDIEVAMRVAAWPPTMEHALGFVRILRAEFVRIEKVGPFVGLANEKRCNHAAIA